MRRGWIVGVAVMLALGTATPAGAAKPSTSCKRALVQADRLSDSFAEYIVTVIESSGTDDASLRAKFKLMRLLTSASGVMDDYASAAKVCRSGK